MARQVRHVTYRNGTTAAYILAAGNSFLQLLFAFGVHVTPQQNVAIAAFTNAVWMLGVRLTSLPYQPEPPKLPAPPPVTIHAPAEIPPA